MAVSRGCESSASGKIHCRTGSGIAASTNPAADFSPPFTQLVNRHFMLRLRKSDLDEMRRHAEETYPHECCGILLGRFIGDDREVVSVARCSNVRTDSPQNRYSIDPLELIRIQRSARECGLEVIGFYHSHPDHPARWSTTDLAEAHWIGCSYVITSVRQRIADETNSFRLCGKTEDDKAFRDEPIVVA
jgi:proteasome lid subunit RPN8/RPN11